jgi:hypothetical protein
MKCRITGCNHEATEGDLCPDCFSELYLSEPAPIGPIVKTFCVVLVVGVAAGIACMACVDELINWVQKAGM